MAKKQQNANEQAIKAAKLASLQRLSSSLATSLKNGTLRPVDPNAAPIVMPLRVK
jgi:hypothetical protein